jgi:hypothetical protein
MGDERTYQTFACPVCAEDQLTEARLWAVENVARARGLAQAIGDATPYPPHIDGVRDIAAEIATLLTAPDGLVPAPQDREPAT